MPMGLCWTSVTGILCKVKRPHEYSGCNRGAGQRPRLHRGASFRRVAAGGVLLAHRNGFSRFPARRLSDRGIRRGRAVALGFRPGRRDRLPGSPVAGRRAESRRPGQLLHPRFRPGRQPVALFRGKHVRGCVAVARRLARRALDPVCRKLLCGGGSGPALPARVHRRRRFAPGGALDHGARSF